MKNIVRTLAAVAFGALCMNGNAQDLVNVYNGALSVGIDGGDPTINEQNVTIEKGTNAGTIKLSITDFALGSGEDEMPIGNIVVDNIGFSVADENIDLNELYQEVAISNGTDENESWQGPLLTEQIVGKDKPEGGKYAGIPVTLTAGSGNTEGLVLSLSIFFEPLNQSILVTFEGEAAANAVALGLGETPTGKLNLNSNNGSRVIRSISGAIVRNINKPGVYFIFENGKSKKVSVK